MWVQRAAASHLVNCVRGHFTLTLHLFEHVESLGELARLDTLVDDSRVRRHQPSVEPLAASVVQEDSKPMCPGREGIHVRSLFHALELLGVLRPAFHRLPTCASLDCGVGVPHLRESLEGVRRSRVSVWMEPQRKLVVGPLHPVLCGTVREA